MRILPWLIVALVFGSGCGTTAYKGNARHEIDGDSATFKQQLKSAYIASGFTVSDEGTSLIVSSDPYPGPKRGFVGFKRQWQEAVTLTLHLREVNRVTPLSEKSLPPQTIATEEWKIEQRQGVEFPWQTVEDSWDSGSVIRNMRSTIYQISSKVRTSYEN